MINSSIYQFLLNNEKSKNYPFHMPGHKRNSVFLPYDFSIMDITEFPGADNLHAPQGLILQAQQTIAKLYAAKSSYMLVNGSSSGILAALLTVSSDGDEVIVARNCHCSVYHAFILSGAKPIYINPDITDYGVPGGISPNALETLLIKHPDCKAVIITSPTYEGFCSNIQAITNIVHKHKKILIVDEAHGAHFGVHPYFPLSANAWGADIVIQSFHKTLPALNQSAVLHVNGDAINESLLKKFLSIVQTSSPSYLLLAIMEDVAQKLLEDPELYFEPYVSLLETSRERLKDNQVIRLVSQEILDQWSIHDVDLGKLFFFMHTKDLTGQGLYQSLMEHYGVQLEMAGIACVLAMTSYADTPQGFEKLVFAITDIDKHLNFSRNFTTIYTQPEMPSQFLLLREVYKREIISIPLSSSLHQISGDFITPYPPGIPLLIPGEQITEGVLQQILQYIEHGFMILGVDDMHVKIVL